MADAGAVVDFERAPWDGDLRHFSVAVWAEDGDVAAMVAAEAGHARLWINSRHVSGAHGWLVWLWARKRARRKPLAVLMVHELPVWLPPDASAVPV
jgi:hypothetical protein